MVPKRRYFINVTFGTCIYIKIPWFIYVYNICKLEKTHPSYVNCRPNPKYNNLSSSEDEEDDDSTQLKKLRRSPRKNIKSFSDIPPLPELHIPVIPQPSPSSSSSLPKQNEPEKRLNSSPSTAASLRATPEVSTKPRVSG